MVGKLNYLTIMKPNLSHVLGIISQFMKKLKQCHLDAVMQVLQYIKGALRKGQYTRAMDISKLKPIHILIMLVILAIENLYLGFVGGNLMTWRSKK